MRTAAPSAAARTILLGAWREVGFRLDLPEAMAQSAIELLPPGWESGRSLTDAPCWSLTPVGDAWRAEGPTTHDSLFSSAEVALAYAVGSLELHVAEHAAGVIAVHAGVVAWKGRALVLPGRTMAGKSTLVHHLVAAGAQYCSDEYALLTAEGAVLPYPRPLSLRPVGGGAPARIPLRKLGEVPQVALPVSLVAALQYRSESDWQVREVSAAAGAMALLGNTVAARSRPVEAMDHVCAASAGTVAVEGFRGEAAEAADRLMGLMHDTVLSTRE